MWMFATPACFTVARDWARSSSGGLKKSETWLEVKKNDTEFWIRPEYWLMKFISSTSHFTVVSSSVKGGE